MATIGPWNGGFGTRADNLQVAVLVTHSSDGLQFEQQNLPNTGVSSSVRIEEIQDGAGALSQPLVNDLPVANTFADSPVLSDIISPGPDLQSMNTDDNTTKVVSSKEHMQDLVQLTEHVGDNSALLNLTEATASDLEPTSQASGSVSTIAHRKGKAQAPTDCSQLRRSSRSNKYDGFKVHQPTDSRTHKSKVKPRVVPSALKINEAQGETADSDEIPPPTTISVMQAVGVQLCAVPEEELTEEALNMEIEEQTPSAA